MNGMASIWYPMVWNPVCYGIYGQLKIELDSLAHAELNDPFQTAGNFSCCCSSKHTTAAATFHPSSFVPCPCRRANPQSVTWFIGFPSRPRDADVQLRVEPTPRRFDVKQRRQSRLRCIFPARRVAAPPVCASPPSPSRAPRKSPSGPT